MIDCCDYIICMYENEETRLEFTLKQEQKDLISSIQSSFWGSLLYDIAKKHTYQNDFFLFEENLAFTSVEERIKPALYDLSHIYDLKLSDSYSFYSTEFKLLFDFYDYNQQKPTVCEISIVICTKDITIGISPVLPFLRAFELFLRAFELSEYILVQNIIQDLCEELFGKRKLNQLLTKIHHIEKSSENLTFKTIEIAQNSIKALYNTSEQKLRSLYQKSLYSDMVINEENVRILHKDFLEDPGILINRLKNKEQALTK